MLEALGILFIALIVLVGFFAIRFYLRIKNAFADSQLIEPLINILPPLELDLIDSQRQRWSDLRALDAHESLLAQSGFALTGYFNSLLGLAEIELALWSHPKNGIVVAFMEASAEGVTSEGVYCDVFVRFNDGSNLTISNAPSGYALPRPEHSVLIREESQDLKHLFVSLKANIPQGKKISPVKQAKSVYVRCFEDYSDWLWQEEQLRSEELSAIAKTLKFKLDDEAIESLLAYAHSERCEIRSQTVIDAFARQSNLSIEKWEQIRDRLVVVHEGMGGLEIADCVYALIPEVEESLEEALDELGEEDVLDDALQAFTVTLKNFHLLDAVKRIAQIRQGLRAEIYLAPKAQ